MKKPMGVAIMNQPTWLSSFFILLFLLPAVSQDLIYSPNSIPYSDHCASIIPESSPTGGRSRSYTISPYFERGISYFTGGERIFGNSSSSFDPQQHVSLSATENVFGTNTSGVYKIQAYLHFLSSDGFICLGEENVDYGYIGRAVLIFVFDGFWSPDSGKLCMVGSGSCNTKEGNLKFDAVLKLNCPVTSNISTQLIAGTMESLASPNDPQYFQPVSILAISSSHSYRPHNSKPRNYKYTLVSAETDRGCSVANKTPTNRHSLGLWPPIGFCSRLPTQMDAFELDPASNCTFLKNCTIFGQGICRMSLKVLHCSEYKHKVQYLMAFGNHSHFMEDARPFDPTRTLLAEGSWDGNKNRLCIVACRILDSTGGNARVGDCSISLSLKYPYFSSIFRKHKNSMVGETWIDKTVNELGYFNRTKFGSNGKRVMGVPGLRNEHSNDNRVMGLPGLRYEHTTETAWDVIILCGGVLFAVVIYVQRRFGGRGFVLWRFRDAGSK